MLVLYVYYICIICLLYVYRRAGGEFDQETISNCSGLPSPPNIQKKLEQFEREAEGNLLVSDVLFCVLDLSETAFKVTAYLLYSNQYIEVTTF